MFFTFDDINVPSSCSTSWLITAAVRPKINSSSWGWCAESFAIGMNHINKLSWNDLNWIMIKVNLLSSRTIIFAERLVKHWREAIKKWPSWIKCSDSIHLEWPLGGNENASTDSTDQMCAKRMTNEMKILHFEARFLHRYQSFSNNIADPMNVRNSFEQVISGSVIWPSNDKNVVTASLDIRRNDRLSTFRLITFSEAKAINNCGQIVIIIRMV